MNLLRKTPMTNRSPARALLLRPILAALLLAATSACGGGDDTAEEEEETADYLEVDLMLLESMTLSMQNKDLHRAKALAVQAMASAGDNDRLRAAAELAAAMAERARGDLDAFLRHVDNAIAKMAVEERSTAVVIDAAKTRASRGEVGAARDMLRTWEDRAEDEKRQPEAERARRAEAALLAPGAEPEPGIPAPEGGEEEERRPRPRTKPRYPIVVP
ncbi:MAG: hypothetical protein ACQEXJ_02965 [Myxococcota bacterium]